ncbi:hypothetical protein [Sphaerisporangium corydalis]|uniref:Secreted protein n=1 Tax=Sphaerisporangium corydalis TaxID=1441875 RepID=A0ABV9ESK7_9ACTN|nr:hypothetical protein [Sphaerisporangium corydalis]
MKITRRARAFVVVIATLMALPAMAPAAHADVAYTCTTGTPFVPVIAILGPLQILAHGCTPATGQPGPGTIRVPSGIYHCNRVTPITPGFVNGVQCD